MIWVKWFVKLLYVQSWHDRRPWGPRSWWRNKPAEAELVESLDIQSEPNTEACNTCPTSHSPFFKCLRTIAVTATCTVKTPPPRTGIVEHTWNSSHGPRHQWGSGSESRPGCRSEPAWTNPSSHLHRKQFQLSLFDLFLIFFKFILFFTRFLVADVNVKGEDDEQSDQSGPPVDDKHDNAAQDRTHKRHPHVVVLEAWAPPCGRRWEQQDDKKWNMNKSVKLFIRVLHFINISKSSIIDCPSWFCQIYLESWPGMRGRQRNLSEHTRPEKS